MNEQIYNKTISHLALDYGQAVYDYHLFEAKANEQISHLEAVLKDKDQEIEQLKSELSTYREVTSNEF